MNMRPSLDGTTRLPAMLLSVAEERDAASVTRTMILDGRSIFFRVTGPCLPPPLELADFAVIASIFTAMRKRRPLHVVGTVSTNLLRQLEEFQEVWASWLPDLYGIVPVTADFEVEIEGVGSRRKGAFAFSGGLDSTFSLLRHVRRKAGRRTVEPVVAVLIQGFDLPLGNPAALDAAKQNAHALLDEVGVPLAIVETNWKRDLCYNWRMEHGAGLAACLNQFNGVADVMVAGGDEGYNKIDLPWGSSPVTNPMLSSGVMDFRTEGMGFPRSERLAFIAENSNLAAKIRVCWENGNTGRNCGICEKCIRTQYNFRAIGIEPKGFDRTAGLLRLAAMPTHSRMDRYIVSEAQAAARRRGLRGWWRAAGYVAMAKHTVLAPVIIAKNKLKQAIRRNERLYEYIREKRRNG